MSLPTDRRSHCHTLKRLATLLLLLGAGMIRADYPLLPPHTAEYRLSRNGLVFATMVTQLEYEESGYRFEARTRANGALSLINKALALTPNASLTEISEGSLKSGRYLPSHYRYRRESGDRRELAIRFDWDAQRARIDSENQPWSMNIPPGTTDKLAVLLRLRQDLSQDAEALTYAVADGGKLKRYRYRYRGEEKIDTPAGSWKSIKFSRHKDDAAADYRLWLAPELTYLPILVERTEKDSIFLMELVRVDTGERSAGK